MSTRRKDLSGQRFGKLLVIEYAFTKNQKSHWHCVCDCGNKLIAQSGNLQRGSPRSCGKGVCHPFYGKGLPKCPPQPPTPGVCAACGSDFLKARAFQKFCTTEPCQKARKRHAAALYKERHPNRRTKSHRDWALRRQYGISLEEWEALVEAADGCEICGSKEMLCCDHDHETGVIRGVLCRTCNSGLGLLGDTLERMTAAVTYLSRTATISQRAGRESDAA